MNEILLSAFGVLLLGITTTMHPCPFTTNITAISLISGVSSRKKSVFGTLIGFSGGYLLAYLLLAFIINFSLIAIPSLSQILQRGISAFLGPMLILVGMVLVKLINLNRFYKNIALSKNYWLTGGSLPASFLLGATLALTFCPATASIFFGIMVPLSVMHGQLWLFPIMYGAGALFPIITISVLVNRGLIKTLDKKWATQIPQIAGWFLILMGIYISLEQLYL